jgi:transposase
VVKGGELLAREGVVVPERTLHRYALQVLGYGRGQTATVRVADCEPGAECQVGFGKMGLLDDPQAGRRRVVHALIFTAVCSRHCFVWLTFRQDLAAVIAGCEAAWAFFGGVFGVLIPDNMAAIVDRAHPLEPRLNRAFAEYAQDRGFAVDPARVRRPADKPVVERTLGSVSTLFAQHVAGYVGRSVEHRGKDAEAGAAWSMTELQSLLDEWIVAVFSDRFKINICSGLLFHVTDMSATRA